MESELTLPGSIPGLLRRGSPVYDARDDLYGTVVEAPMGLAVYSPTEGDGDIHHLDDEWGLDLHDATGRAHAAWWVAERVKWWPGHPAHAVWRCMEDMMRQSSAMEPFAWGIGPGHWWPSTHHALAHLNPNDPRTLPDGSRYVDALALKLVCEHLAGGAV